MPTLQRLIWVAFLSLGLSVACAAAEPLDRERAERQAGALHDMMDELQSGRPPRESVNERVASGDRINQAFVALTGEAINPLFGITVLGMYRYFTTDEAFRSGLPIYEQPVVWIPLLILILLMLFNTTVCSVAPFMNAPLNIVGNITNTLGAAAVLPLVLKMFADSFAAPVGAHIAQATNFLFPAAYAAEAGANSSLWLSLGWCASLVIGFFSYLVVWLTAYTVDVLVLLSPWSVIDALLKSLRIAVMGGLALLNQLSTGLALVAALILVVFSACFSVVAVKMFVRAWKFILGLFFKRREAVS